MKDEQDTAIDPTARQWEEKQKGQEEEDARRDTQHQTGKKKSMWPVLVVFLGHGNDKLIG